MSKIPVSKVVSVTVNVSPTFPQGKGFGLALILTDSAPSNASNTSVISFYSGMDSVSADWATTSEAYKAANIFFMQSPRPEQIAISSIKAGETVTEALVHVNDANNGWYGLTLAMVGGATDAEILEAAAWTEAQTRIFGYTTNELTSLDASSITSVAYKLNKLGYSRTFGQYDDNDAYAIVSAMARILTTNFAMKDSTITLKFKQEPGVTPINITETQRQALIGNKLNYYTYFGDSAMLAEGVVANGRFLDEVIGLDWLQNTIQTQVFGYLLTRTTKVPQTDKGVAALLNQANIACDAAVNCGLLAPGTWNGMDLGEVKSGDFLPKGYYSWAPKVATQTQSDREARKSPPIQILAKGAGAIHGVDIALTFER